MIRLGLLLATRALLVPATAGAQPVDLPIPAAKTSQYPPGISVRNTATGPVYVNARNQTLYGMDMRTVIRWSPDAAQYCQAECAKDWQPILAPEGSRPNIKFPTGPNANSRQPPPAGFVAPQSAPDWSVIVGPAGPQWVYKGWHLVFVHNGDKPGSSKYDGTDNLTWNTLKFVPPVPQVAAPPGIKPVFHKGAYLLADIGGHALFTGRCGKGCAWTPFAAPLAGRGMGDWAVDVSGELPQWRWKGRKVYVSQKDDPMMAPAEAKVLRP
jgi:predicted lipoprotein with Yx(FWY)xxD motif